MIKYTVIINVIFVKINKFGCVLSWSFCSNSLIGSLYGRMIGLVMVSFCGVNIGDNYWKWMDPGAFALIGAASFMGGVTRLTMTVTVIMVSAFLPL